jgi:hypothetical protein
MLFHSLRCRTLPVVVLGAALAATATATQPPSTLTFSDSIPVTNTNWSLSVTLPKFDPALGTLQTVTLTLDGHIEGQAAVESTDASPTTITTMFQANLTLARPDMSILAVVIPQVTNMANLSPFDGVIDFRGTSGITYPNLMQNASQSVTSPPPASDLPLFTGTGTITLPVTAVGTSTAIGSGNVITQFATRASAVVTVVYQFAPVIVDCNGNGIDDSIDISSGTSADCDHNGVPDECQPDCDNDGVPDVCETGDCDGDGIPDDCDEPCPECVEVGFRNPGSLLIYPIFDNRDGNVTLVTVTNENCDMTPINGGLFAGTVDVEFVYIGRFGPDGIDLPCLETNRTRRLSPCDTLTLWTNADNPNNTLGYLYVFAKNPFTGRAIVWNHLIGEVAIFGGPSGLHDSIDAIPFLGIGNQGAETDQDHDNIRDLNNVEYTAAPDQLLIPRFLGQDPAGPGSIFRSDLILIGLSGGTAFDTTVNFLIYNDNEEEFSAQYTFRCWADPLLVTISGTFLESFLDTTNNDPTEIRGRPDHEAGWFKVNGFVATSSAAIIEDPAIYAVLVERTAGYAAAALPFELCSQTNGALLPHSIFGDL